MSEPKSWDDVNETAHLNEASMEVTHTEFMRWQNRIAAVEAERDALREALDSIAEQCSNVIDTHENMGMAVVSAHSLAIAALKQKDPDA